MRVKSYFAASVEAAMTQARQELGPEAMLLTSRKAMPEARHLGDFEVVFGTETERVTSQAAVSTSPSEGRLAGEIAELRRQMEAMASRFRGASSASISSLIGNPELGEVFSSLLAADIDGVVAQRIVSSLRARHRLSKDNLASSVREEAGNLLRVDSTLGRTGSDRRVVAFAGPPGSGKTTTLIKVAVRYGIQSRKSMQILTTDLERVAAADQLQTYATILGVGCQVIETKQDLRQALDEHKNKDLILIDTPGYSPADAVAADEMASMLAGHREVDVQLVLSATTKPSDLSRAVDRFASFCSQKLIFTRLDETETFGPILNEAARTGIAVSFLANGQRIPEDIEPATRGRLLDSILGQTPKHFSAAVA